MMKKKEERKERIASLSLSLSEFWDIFLIFRTLANNTHNSSEQRAEQVSRVQEIIRSRFIVV